MDRLINPNTTAIEIFFIPNQTSSHTLLLTNLMHTMPVAVSLTSTNPAAFSFPHPLSLIPPLSTSSFTLHTTTPSPHPPLSVPPDTVLVRSSMLPTGKAHLHDLRCLFSKPGPHIFTDAILPVHFIGPHAAEFLLSSPLSFKSPDVDNLLFSKAISSCDESHLTSLLGIAIKNQNLTLISALIEAGADVNGRDSEGESMILLAVESKNIDAVKILIKSGAVIDGGAVFHVGAAANRVDVLEVLCLGFVGIDLNSAVNKKHQTPLHTAAINGHAEAIQFLASMGCEVDVEDDEGFTPLHYAAQRGHLQAVDSLLNQNNMFLAKHSITKEGKTAYALAVEEGHYWLYDSLHLADLLSRAARSGDVETMKGCLDEGARVNGRDQNGWTPLHRAAFKGQMESVRVLIDRGARLDLADSSGYTPLLLAAEGGHVEVAICLLQFGAKACVKSLELMMACDLECFKKQTCAVKYLPLVVEENMP